MDLMEFSDLFIGVDVGTSSVRAALVTSQGNILANVTQNITVWEPGSSGFYEQSSTEIWDAVCSVVNSVSDGVDKNRIKGIGFDATCSLVVLDDDFNPLAVNEIGESHWNIIMWMDHRAASETETINQTKHEVLKNVGGVMSLEMQMPKLLWLKQNLKNQCWDKVGHFFDLPDFLTWKATGSLSRSLCSLVCKWTYQADRDGNKGWNDGFLKQIGLEDLIAKNYSKIGNEVHCPGELCGHLNEAAAAKMGLPCGIPVATSIIDAHAGGIGTLGCNPSGVTESVPLTARLALICGTSTCHMIASEQPCFVPGVWGPYFSAMVPGLWLNEAGQSATGKLIDHILETHPAFAWIKGESDKRKLHPQNSLNEVLESLATIKKVSLWELTEDLHVWPDFHGNRSPIADSTLKGMVCGLTLDSGVESLASLYLATLQSLAYGTRHIIETLRQNGHNIEWLYICGGLRKNPVFLQTHADVLGLPIICPDAKESVLLGAAMLGACASSHFPSLQDAMQEMNGNGQVVQPNKSAKRYHDKKYTVFLKMVEHQKFYRSIMKEENA